MRLKRHVKVVKHFLSLTCLWAGVLAAVSTALGSSAPAPQFRIVSRVALYHQIFGIVEGSPGTLYSSAQQAVFSVTIQGEVVGLANFPSRVAPLSSPIPGPDEKLYSSVYGTAGSVPSLFSVRGAANSLVQYPRQALTATLTQSLPDGTFLGTAIDQSTCISYVVRADTNGNVTRLYEVPAGESYIKGGPRRAVRKLNPDQLSPHALIYASDGNYYGLVWQRPQGLVSSTIGYIGGDQYPFTLGGDSPPRGVSSTIGYVFRLTPTGAVTILDHLLPGTFSSDTAYVPLIQATDGNLYGTTAGPGGLVTDFGSVYRLTLKGQFTTIYAFADSGGAIPESMVQASDGNLYIASIGMTGNGEISRVTLGGQYTLIHKMTPRDGTCPCWLTQASDGIIYGTATSQGPDGAGTVFALDLGLPKPAPQVLTMTPTSGPAGTVVRIWGYNLLSAAVRFNGIASTRIHGSGPNYVFATVPVGAKSGPVTVITPGGKSTLPIDFWVTTAAARYRSGSICCATCGGDCRA
jgi:uncharacterized repeat protein (TIGR03803 family)